MSRHDNAISEETERVRVDWAGRAPAWDRRADEMAEMAERFNVPLIKAAKIRAGHSVVDLATGAGEPALSVAKAIAPDGRLVATDLVADMIAGAERRAAVLGITNISFQVADMTKLPFGDESFDRAICRFGLMFVPEPERATREAARVLKPGGRVAYMVWGPRGNTTMFAVFASAAEAVFGKDDALIDLHKPFALSETGALTKALEAGGFTDIEEREIRFAPKIPAGTRFWAAQMEMAMGRRLEQASDRERNSLEDAVERGFARHLKNDEYQLSAHVRIGVGVKP